MGGATLLLFFGSRGTPVAVPGTLLAAIRQFWVANSLTTVVAPLYAYAAPAGLTRDSYPFIIIDAITDMLPGETPTDLPVEMFATVHARSGENAALTKSLMEDWLRCQVEPTPGDSPVVNPNRTAPLSWSTGSENFNEPNETVPSIAPALGPGSVRVFKQRIHITWWITGRP